MAATPIGELNLRVRRVNIVGNARTHTYVVEDQLQEAYEASTAEEVYVGLARGAHRLDGLGLFDSVHILMDAAEDGSFDQTDVTVTVKEKNWYSIQAGTTTAGTSLDASKLGNFRYSVSGKLLNGLGHGEKVDVGFNSPIAGKEGRTINARLALPTLLRTDASFNVEGIVDTVDLTKFASVITHRRGVTATARSFDGSHTLAAEMCLRELVPRVHPTVPYAYAASLGIVAEANKPSAKSSLKYTFTDDQRDDPFVPTMGSYIEASMEGAGLLGDTTFAKGTIELQKHFPLTMLMYGSVASPISLSLCASGGAIRPLGSCKRTFFSDRFDLGGPMSLRGFPYYGVGPRAPKEEGGCTGGDALCGDIKYTASASLGFPFPFPALAAAGWRGYIFTNLGNLTTWDTPLKQYPRDTRMSVGIAAAWNFVGAGRVEINYARVLRQSPMDLRKDHMLQLGFGVSFT